MPSVRVKGLATRGAREGLQRIGGCDCLLKTQRSANTKSGRIRRDACPVPEG